MYDVKFYRWPVNNKDQINPFTHNNPYTVAAKFSSANILKYLSKNIVYTFKGIGSTTSYTSALLPIIYTCFQRVLYKYVVLISQCLNIKYFLFILTNWPSHIWRFYLLTMRFFSPFLPVSSLRSPRPCSTCPNTGLIFLVKVVRAVVLSPQWFN